MELPNNDDDNNSKNINSLARATTNSINSINPRDYSISQF